jgi:O-antigen/teichoic acid export membrane protein
MDYTRQIGSALTASLMPVFSELESRSERDLMRTIYLDYSRLFLILSLPIIVLLFVYGGPFIGIWIGPEYEERGQIVLYLLAGGVLIESLQPLLWRFFIGVGHLNFLVKISAIVSALVIVSAMILVRSMGIAGVALAGLIGSVVAQIAYAIETCRYLEISPAKLVESIHLRPLLAGGILYGVAVAAEYFFGSESHLAMGGGVAIGIVVYAGVAIAFGLKSSERTALRAKSASLLRRVGIGG